MENRRFILLKSYRQVKAFLKKLCFLNFFHYNPKIILPIIFWFFQCSTNEFKYIGTTDKLKESYFYGSNFVVTLQRVEEANLLKLKSEIKNAIALSEEKGRLQEWKEVGELSSKEKDIFLFQIFPETRVLPEFLQFTFECGGSKISPSHKYYSLNTSTSIRTNVYQSYPVVMGIGPSIPYYYRPYPADVDVTIIYKHTYSFVMNLSKNSCMGKKGDRFRAITPSGNYIDFERNH
jgi:hypothetical protein